MSEGGSLIDDPLSVESVLDLCTGSGCLAILASRNFPNAAIDAVDISKDALEVAARNVADYGLEDRLTLHRGDLFKPLGGKRYDLIITNPPYVDADGMAALPRECRAEPKLAFDGGADGLDIVRRILDEARRISRRRAGCCARSAAAAKFWRRPTRNCRCCGSIPKTPTAKCSGSAPPICEPPSKAPRLSGNIATAGVPATRRS